MCMYYIFTKLLYTEFSILGTWVLLHYTPNDDDTNKRVICALC